MIHITMWHGWDRIHASVASKKVALSALGQMGMKEVDKNIQIEYSRP
jgi:hypothetical protein